MFGRRPVPALLAASAAFAAVLVAGCGDDDGGARATPADGTFVGRVEGSDAYIALVANGKEVTGYVCDGKQVSVWFGEPGLQDGRAELVSRRGEPLGAVSFSEDGASGEVTIAAGRHRFRAQPATSGAGLYRLAEGSRGQPGFSETGWVVLADGSERGGTNFIDPTTDEVVSKPAPKRTTAATKVDTGFIDPTRSTST